MSMDLRSLCEWTAICLAVTTLAACSGLGGGSNNGGGNDGTVEEKKVTLDNLPERLSKVYCQKFFSCCSTSEQKAVAGAGIQSEGACRDRVTGILTKWLPRYRKSVNDGRLKFDGEAMAECISKKEAGDCSGYHPDRIFLGCRQAGFKPQVVLGGTCEFNLACRKGYCHTASGENANNTCKQQLSGGEKCFEVERICGSGLHCDVNLDGPSVCKPEKPNGESCETGGECKSDWCAESGACAPKKAGGDSCKENFNCRSGYCNNGGDGKGTCLGKPLCSGN